MRFETAYGDTPIDWPALNAEIIDGLDIVAEYEALGVRFSGKVRKNGWREAFAVHREDRHPSAAVNATTGVYKSDGDGGEILGFFDFAAKYAKHGDWIATYRHYADKARVVLPFDIKPEELVAEATYPYLTADGELLYEVIRYRVSRPKEKSRDWDKTFKIRRPINDGRFAWHLGDVEPVPYRLPELLSSHPDDTVWIGEGEKIVDRLSNLGLVATTNHGGTGNSGVWKRFKDYFAARNIVILPDNDETGRRHATLIALALQDVVRSVKLLPLPDLPRKGDVCDWLDAGNSLDELIRLAEEAKEWEPDSEGTSTNGQHAAPSRPGNLAAEAADDPHRLARLFLEQRNHVDGRTVRYWAEEWHQWDGCAWRGQSEREIAAELTGIVKTEFDRLATETGKSPLPVTTRSISNVIQALRHLALLTLKCCPRQPAWVDRTAGEDFPDPSEILAASNTLIHLPSFVAGEPATLPLTPCFFSPNSLGYAFNPSAPSPTQWLKFLDDLWGEDQESIDALQEWFGYLLTPDTSQQKMLMLIGPKRSGKGTIGRVLRSLIGPANVTAPTLSGLATNFGLAPLIGKTVALIADARLSNRADGQVIVERLLSISGEDAQTIDRKHLSSWTGSLTTRFVLISNELPRLGDSSGALPSRMILLRLTRSFFGEEDAYLSSRLFSELPGILLWSIDGWARFRTRGRFFQPRSGQELLDDLGDLSSPIGTFIEERCRVDSAAEVEVKALFEAWKGWCTENGRDHPGDIAGFGRNLRAVIPRLQTVQERKGPDRVRVFRGIELEVSHAF